MKAPSLLLLALAAVLPSLAAAADIPHRCDVEWLKAAQAVAQAGGVPAADPKGYLVDEAIPNGTRKVVKFSDKSALCDPTVWHLLAIEAPVNPDAAIDPTSHLPVGGLALRWNDDGAKQAWALGLNDQLKILLAADALYSYVDPRADAALVKADAAVQAAAKLGAVSAADAPGAAKVKDVGYTSAFFAAVKNFAVSAPAAGAAAPAPADLKASLSRLLKDAPAAGAAKGPLPGPAVIAFRRAVIELADELSVRGSKADLSAKYGVSPLVKKDFALPPSGPRWVAVGPVTGAAPTGKSAILDAAAAKDDVYAAALKFVTDPAITAADDTSTHDSAALSRLDYGARNLLAIAAANVQAAVDAAKKKLGTSTVKAALAAVDHDLKASAAPAAAPNSLSADVLERLNANADFKNLNALYDNNKTNAVGAEALARINAMKADAAATRVVGGKLQYSVGGQKLTDEGLRVADLATDKTYEDFIAGVVADQIDSNPLSASLKAALASLGHGPVIAPPTAPQQDVAHATLPPPPPPPPAPPAATTTWNAVVAATPAPFLWGLFDSRGTMERYRQAQLDQAAADAAAQGLKRQQAQAKFDQAKAQLAVQQQKEKDGNAAKAQDPTWSRDAAAKWLKAQNDAVDAAYAQKVESARKSILEASGLQTQATIDANLTARKAAADAAVDAAYADGIAQSVKQLQASYKKSGSDQWSAEASASGYGRFYGNHLDVVDAYFAGAWTGDKQSAAVAACRAKLWGSATYRTGRGGRGTGTRTFFNDPNPDNVDASCVRADLTGYLRSELGKLAPAK